MQNKSPSNNIKLNQGSETAAMLKFTENSHYQSPMYSDVASHFTGKINQGPSGGGEGSPYFSSSVLNKQPMDVIPEQIDLGAKANSILNLQSSAN